MAYLPLAIFLLLSVAAIAGEAIWLAKRGWTTSGKAWIFVIATDVLGLGIGGFMSFAIFGIMLMMTFGPAGTGGTSSEASYWALTVLAILFPPVVLLAVKRIFLLFFAMRTGAQAWAYSAIAAVAVSVIVAIPPPVAYYLLSRFA